MRHRPSLIVPLSGLLLLFCTEATHAQAGAIPLEIIHFESNNHTLGGELYKPDGAGPFPVVLYNHGSAPAMLNSQAAKAIGPLFAAKGWVFFMPYRRGQGLSGEAGAYIGDEINAAEQRGGLHEASKTMTRLLRTEQLDDQLAAFAWLRAQSFVQPNRVAVAGNSFGGVEAILGASKVNYCAAVVASGGAESWGKSPELQSLMTDAVEKAENPMLFFQAANDFDLAPSHVLSAARTNAQKSTVVKIYPPFGTSAEEGHSFAYRGANIWFPDVFQFIAKNCP